MFLNSPFDVFDSNTKHIVLTHRNTKEARSILNAVGLDGERYNLISADHLFVELLLNIISGAYNLKLKKNLAGRLIGKFGNDNSPHVMLDDKIYNLLNMLDAGIIRYGLLVPTSVMLSGDSILIYDMSKAFSLAKVLSAGCRIPFDDYFNRVEIRVFADNVLSSAMPLSAYADSDGKFINLPEGKIIFALPLEPVVASKQSYNTGVVLAKEYLSLSSVGRFLKKCLFW